MPGLKTTTYGTGDYSWLLNTHGLNDGGQGVAKAANFTKATHYPDGYLRCGLPLDMADRSNLKPWADVAGAVLAYADGDQPFDGTENVTVALVTHADGIITKNVPGTFTKPTTAPQSQFGQYL